MAARPPPPPVMVPAAASSFIPPGLAYLAYIDTLIVNQQVDMLEVFTGFETKNRYVISNSLNQQVYYAYEENDFLTMNYLGSSRPFDIIIMDNARIPALRVHRPYQLEGCGCLGLVQKIEVSTGAGILLGTVTEEWQCCGKKFQVENATGQLVFTIEGPACTFDYFDTDFNVSTVGAGSVKVGAITRQFAGLAREMFTNADVFGVRFPKDLDVAMKAVLLGATFLIDFMYYERRPNEDDNPIGGPGPGGVLLL